MAVKVKRSNLQLDKYNYVWSRDKGDGEYAGKLDQIRVDKDEGYEVLDFIQGIMNKHKLTYLHNVHNIEDALHDDSLSAVVMRDELTRGVEGLLGM